MDHYAALRPVLDFRQYFDGDVQAHGLVTDRRGRVRRRFTVAMQCRWEGDAGTLDEAFVYDDGEQQHRQWRVQRHAGGHYTATAGDVIGEARGRGAGAAFNWRYTLRLPVGQRTYDVQFDDWMYAIDAQHVINKAQMRKFGVRVGEVTVSFVRP